MKYIIGDVFDYDFDDEFPRAIEIMGCAPEEDRDAGDYIERVVCKKTGLYWMDIVQEGFVDVFYTKRNGCNEIE